MSNESNTSLKKEAKDFIKERTQLCNEVLAYVQQLVRFAIDDIIKVSRKYHIKPSRFTFSANTKLKKEVDQIIAKLLEDILGILENAVSYGITGEGKRKRVIKWLYLTYKGGTINSRLAKYLDQLLYQLQPQVAAVLDTTTQHMTDPAAYIAARLGNVTMSKYYIHAKENNFPNTMRLTTEAGVYANAYNSITRAVSDQVARTRQKVYYDIMHPSTKMWEVFRGSRYPCSLCDSMCGIVTSRSELPPFHPNCCCFAVPLISTETL